ncbi:MAG: SRPBCC domain-containing protein [Acidobacteriota bacterium]|nr:SRPBCC domain-containing protein [Acidobacteriota bacterium]
MPDIFQDVPINSDVDSVFECVSMPSGLSVWWSKSGEGEPGAGNEYRFDFGPGYEWKALVEKYEPGKSFAIRMTESDDDWDGTIVSFRLEKTETGSMLRFEHRGWPKDNRHYRSSAYCWAMYVRCLKNYLEKGETLDYEKRFTGE